MFASVHPRASGERCALRPLAVPGCGSSPRQRGTRRPKLQAVRQYRFIPAPAGNAPAIVKSAGRCPVHPRASGERAIRWSARRSRRGSSPRQRGTHGHRLPALAVDRFIPAPAGNATRLQVIFRWPSVHPRASGERGVLEHFPDLDGGSSPRQRGTLVGRVERVDLARFIPAPAGNAQTRTRRARPSPRQRGTRLHGADRAARQRFIPAPAGNARPAGGRGNGTAVHPRASGERPRRCATASRSCGSSPRQRGTRPGTPDAGVAGRFIPAPAGNAPATRTASSATPVHPRASGERRASVPGRRDDPGSSPRQRGTLKPSHPVATCCRFIPAPAGNA